MHECGFLHLDYPRYLRHFVFDLCHNQLLQCKQSYSYRWTKYRVTESWESKLSLNFGEHEVVSQLSVHMLTSKFVCEYHRLFPSSAVFFLVLEGCWASMEVTGGPKFANHKNLPLDFKSMACTKQNSFITLHSWVSLITDQRSGIAQWLYTFLPQAFTMRQQNTQFLMLVF